jgi:hypothetical protein
LRKAISFYRFVYFASMKNITITGTSRGIGFELVLHLQCGTPGSQPFPEKISQLLIGNENITRLRLIYPLNLN